MYGDITDVVILENTIDITLKRFPNGLDFITADGGFDIKIFEAQEILSSKLLLCEIYLAIKTQKKGGMFIIKFFDMFSHNTIIYYLILCSIYSFVKIIKPKTSRNCNSERYLVCYDFKGLSVELDTSLLEIIKNLKIEQGIVSIIYPNIVFNDNLKKRLLTFNNLIIHEQIKTIKESIKMINNKGYFQNLLIKVFLDKKNKDFLSFKHILASRIKKCTQWLRYYNINTN
jgi:hypothetical protein